MNGHQLGDCLQFNDDDRVDKEVGAIPDLDANVIVLDGQRMLNEDGHPTFSQLMGDTGFVGAFEKAWPQPGMDPHCSMYDLPGSDVDLGGSHDDLNFQPIFLSLVCPPPRSPASSAVKSSSSAFTAESAEDRGGGQH